MPEGLLPVLRTWKRRVRLHMEAINDASVHKCRRWFQTGKRKNHAAFHEFDADLQVPITLADVRMIRIDENIHATHPLYATVAPILHKQKQMRAQPAHHGITPKKGAADADGR